MTASSGRKSKVSVHSTKSRSSSKVSHSLAKIDKKTENAVKLAKIKTELNFAEDEAAKVAELKKFKLTKELAIAQAEMNAISKIEERELGLMTEMAEPYYPDSSLKTISYKIIL